MKDNRHLLLFVKRDKAEDGEKNIHAALVRPIGVTFLFWWTFFSLFTLVVIVCFKAIFGDGMFLIPLPFDIQTRFLHSSLPM